MSTQNSFSYWVHRDLEPRFLQACSPATRFGTPIESHFITKYFKRLDRYGPLESLDNFKRLLKDILAERPVKQWQLEIDVEKLHTSLKDRTDGQVFYADLVEALFLARSSASEKSAWGDKTPHYLADVAILDKLFPKARYLYIVRDGRDVALSLMRKPWGPSNVFAAAEYWQRLNVQADTLQHLQDEERLHFLRYEDLAGNIEGNIRMIGQFLKEDISDSELSLLAATVKRDNCFKWRSQMSSRDIELFDSVASTTLARFGYDAQADAISPNWFVQNTYRVHNWLMWLRFMFETNVIDGFRIRFLGKEPFAD